MKRLVSLSALLCLGCPIIPRTNPHAPIQVFSRSHKPRPTWLGTMVERGTAEFEISADQARCLPGLNFFLVVRKSGRGYWAVRFGPNPVGQIVLVIEKYAGLSVAHAQGDGAFRGSSAVLWMLETNAPA